MPRKIRREYPSLAWIHKVREEHYQMKAGHALGLRVRLPRASKRKTA